MPTVDLHGIPTHYEVVGSGPPLLMFSPGGFNAALDNWSGMSVYAKVRPLDTLAKSFSCIVFDRREAGQSGGRVERLTWSSYVDQGVALLDHLGHDRAFLMGGCQGCSPVVALASAHPRRVAGMVLFWPAGGPRYRISTQARFAQHLGFLRQVGLAGVVEEAGRSGQHFGQDSRLGPWARLLQRDPDFAAAYTDLDVERYEAIVAATGRTLVDRDTVAGAEPEDLLQLVIPALIIPGADPSHATSAARYLQECLPNSRYWDVAPADQTDGAAARIADFLTTLAG